MPAPLPIGLNTYCLRSLRWNDRQLLDYAASQKMDTLFLKDSLDPRTKDPAHWAEVKRWSQELGLKLETGGGVFPAKPEQFQASVDNILYNARRAAAMSSKIIRMVCFGQRSSMSPGPAMQHLETMVKLPRAVKSQVLDLGVRPAIEVHKGLQGQRGPTGSKTSNPCGMIQQSTCYERLTDESPVSAAPPSLPSTRHPFPQPADSSSPRS